MSSKEQELAFQELGTLQINDTNEMKSIMTRKSVKITTCDMHTAGEPLRIVEAGYPEIIGSTMLERLKYAQSHHDHYRQLLMNEPRGHKDMYGAIIMNPYPKDKAHLGVLFLNNEGYSTMCGHAVIALGRYAVDKGFVTPTSPETEVLIDCPCGIVKTFVQFSNGKSGNVRFLSVPAFVYDLDVKINVKGFGTIVVDISYGGAFYALVKDTELGMCISSTTFPKLLEAGIAIIDAVKAQVPLHHPDNEDLAFLYGTIITDDKGCISDQPTKNLCIFADAQVDRCPTGSGVTARIAQLYKRNHIALNEIKEFESLIGTRFTGKAVQKTKCGFYDAIIVEVSGMAYYTGQHTFTLEEGDELPTGFKFNKQ